MGMPLPLSFTGAPAKDSVVRLILVASISAELKITTRRLPFDRRLMVFG